MAEATGERFYSAELLRLRGELLARADDRTGAEASFRAGIEVARRQGARALERKAADSLRRLGVPHR
jgi:predicted ATPase